MKSTGVTRKIDELGRVVIPKEIRRNLGIRDGESLEIFTDQDSIILKKHSEIKKYEDLGKKLCDLIKNIYNLDMIITDREKVISTSLDEKLLNKKLENRLICLIDNRESYISKDLTTLNFENESISGFVTAMPIIASIDSLGLVILVSHQNESYENISKLMAKIIAEKIDIY